MCCCSELGCQLWNRHGWLTACWKPTVTCLAWRLHDTHFVVIILAIKLRTSHAFYHTVPALWKSLPSGLRRLSPYSSICQTILYSSAKQCINQFIYWYVIRFSSRWFYGNALLAVGSELLAELSFILSNVKTAPCARPPFGLVNN
jgi:hypothetical protein